MQRFNTVAILGVGLIGGSIGLGLRRRGLAGEVIGIGRRAATLQIAQEMGAVTKTTTAMAEGVREAELIVVCTPVGRIADDVRAAARHCRAGALITDVGSTKAEIVSSLAGSLPGGARFVGSHPLAGSERSGPAAAEADLFVDRTVLVTPTTATSADDLRAVSAFWQALEAHVVSMDPAEHDRALAATSHLPHLVAAALAAATPRELLHLTASGWKDSTRIALGDAELWRQIFASNRASLLAALGTFQAQITAFHAALERHDDEQLLRLLSAAQIRRDAVP